MSSNNRATPAPATSGGKPASDGGVAPGNAPLLEAENLKVYFPVTGGILRRTVGHVKAVNDVSISIEEKSIVSVVGESGCGKSTLGNALLGLVPITSGSLKLQGRSLDVRRASSWKPFRRNFQIIFQDPYSSLNPRHTIYEILSEPLLVHKIVRTAKEARERVASLLERVGLDADYMQRYPHAFSGGQRQRLAIARAVGLNPKLIVCDEIVAALDVSVAAQIINLLLQLKEELNLSLLFISHDLSMVKNISDRVDVIYLGKILERGAPADLFSRPAHHYTRALLDSIPTLQRGKRPGLLAGEAPSPVNPPPGCTFHTRCPAARDKCRQVEPVLRPRPGGGTEFACHYPLEGEG